MSEREKFETWLKDHFSPISAFTTARAPDGMYYSTVSHRDHRHPGYAEVQMLWETWQAALAAKGE